jgi:predicted anti-sigma-YlaC factor YlaD
MKRTSLKAEGKTVTAPYPTCKNEVALMSAYLSNSLNARIAAGFETHLRDCSDCRAFLRTYKKTIEAMKRFLNIPYDLPRQTFKSLVPDRLP